MGRNIILVEIKFFYIFPVIPVIITYAIQSFFQDRLFAIPQCHGKTQVLEIVGYRTQAVFTPAICPVVGLFKRKIAPCITAVTIVFSRGSPLPFTEIWASPLQGSFLFVVIS